MAGSLEWLKLTTEDILEPDIALCDAHHHLWDHGPDDRYLLEEIGADAASGHKVVSTIFCECRSMYRKEAPGELAPVGETAYMDALAERAAAGECGPARVAAGIIGHADLTLGSGVAAVLEAHRAASPKRFRGIRHMTRWHENPESIDIPPRSPRGLMLDRSFREGLACLEKSGLTFDAWFVFTQYDELVDLARAHPGQTIVINHVGGMVGTGPYEGRREEVMQVWKRGVARAAECPNVMMKLGGLGQPRCGFGWEKRSRPPTSAELAAAYAPYYLYCIEKFGPDRCMFESNFPVERASCSYPILWNAYKRMTREFTPAERAALLHDNAVRIYRLENT